MSITIEIIAAPGCTKCAAAQGQLRAIASALVDDNELLWREVNVLEELDYAVSLGVLSMPAIVVNGELTFSGLPTPAQFEAELTRRVRR